VILHSVHTNNKNNLKHNNIEVIQLSRRRYRGRKHNLLGFSRNEKDAFRFIVGFIKLIIFIIVGIVKGIIASGIYIRKMIKSHKALKDTGYDLNEILDMIYTISPRQFEILICELYKQQGYKAKLTPPSCDYGRDVILNDNIFVECKHFSKDNYVGREICQKLLGSVHMFKAEKAIIITTGKYHKNAYEVAAMVDNLELLDIMDIEKMIFNLEPAQVSKVILRTLNAS